MLLGNGAVKQGDSQRLSTIIKEKMIKNSWFGSHVKERG